jgi:hypothetical protein
MRRSGGLLLSKGWGWVCLGSNQNATISELCALDECVILSPIDEPCRTQFRSKMPSDLVIAPSDAQMDDSSVAAMDLAATLGRP